MKKSKIIIDILVISLGFILFIIWDQNFIRYTVSTSSLSLLKYYDIYLITTNEKDQFWQYMNLGAADMAASTGVNYYWRFPEERNPNKQIEIINEAVNDGAVALLIAADDPKRISGAIEDAKARGVKVIYVDAPANEEAITTLATDNYNAGFVAGQKMISNLANRGMRSGSIGIISLKDKSTSMQREEGFRDALAVEPGYIILQTVYTNGEPNNSQLAAEQLINQNNDLVGLFGTNEGTSEGVGYANKANENRFVGIGFDKSDTTKKLLDDGSLNVIIEQNPYTMGYLGMAEALASLLGKDTGPSYINTGYTVLEE
ncbi:MAG: substrate-binding domain-containing protein [Herbinix sp.]|nr:substrate-binding domain-containing protein [Herbinix sp.]